MSDGNRRLAPLNPSNTLREDFAHGLHIRWTTVTSASFPASARAR